MSIITVRRFDAELGKFENLQRRSVFINEFLSVNKNDSSRPEVFYKIDPKLFVSLGFISQERLSTLTKEFILEQTEQRYQECLLKNLHPWSAAYFILNKTEDEFLSDVEKYHLFKKAYEATRIENTEKEMHERKLSLQNEYNNSGNINLAEMFLISKHYGQLTLSNKLVSTLSKSINWINPKTKQFQRLRGYNVRKDSLIKLLDFTKEFVLFKF